jgi:hypothetical protein
MALLVVVIVVPVLALFCVFASNVGVQDMMVAANDRCHRYAVYDADGAIYGTAKLVSLIAKSDSRKPVEAGKDQEAPGIRYLKPDDDTDGSAEAFAFMVSSTDIAKVKFVKTIDASPGSEEEDFGLGSAVTVEKDYTDSVRGGGAEFGNTYGGIGAQINRIRFPMTAVTSDGSKCPDTNVQILGDYWLIVTKAGQTKGI